MDKLYLADMIGDKIDIIERAMANPALAPKRKPTIEQATKAVAAQVEFATIENAEKRIASALQDAYDMYVIVNGEYEDAQAGGDIAPDEYAAGLDDEVEKALAPFEAALSADWLGNNTIGTALWDENAIDKLAKSAAKEVFKQLSYKKTPAQVLANAGIVQSDIEIVFAQHMQGNLKGPNMNIDAPTAATIAAKIKAHVGADFSQMDVYDDITLAFDDDDILAHGAAARIGLDEKDVDALRMLALDVGAALTDEVFEHVSATDDAPAKTKPTKAKAEGKPAKAKPSPKSDAVDPQVLALVKAHSAAKDTDLSAALGVSRATYNNWLNGKTAFTPDADQYATLRAELVTHINGMLEALALLDGTEAVEVS